MPKFRKKPVIIEAWQVPPSCEDPNIQLHGALVGNLLVAGCHNYRIANSKGEIDIMTLEGTMRASNGDWIIKGVKGEFYPCKPDVFEATYEPVEHANPKPDK